MGRTTRRTQAASHKPVSSIQPNRAAGKPAQAPPANAFRGRPERVPQLVYVADFKSDGFLGQASEYYAFFGLEVKKVKSIHEMVIDLGKREGLFERLCLVSHAHPDPLPKTGRYLTAEIKEKLAHTMPALVGEDRKSITSVCPLPRYSYCIVTRPLPPGEVDGPCGDISNP